MNGQGFEMISKAMHGLDGGIEVVPMPPSPDEHVEFVSVVVPDRVLASSVLNVLSAAGCLQSDSNGLFDLGRRHGPKLHYCGVKGNELIFEDTNLR